MQNGISSIEEHNISLALDDPPKIIVKTFYQH